jgi:hypothetical protein
MTVNRILWKEESLGETEFFNFKKLYDLFLWEDDKDFRDHLDRYSSDRLVYFYERIKHPKNLQRGYVKGEFILNKWNKGRKQKIGIDYLIDCIDKLADAIIDLVVLNAMQPERSHRWRFLQATLRNLDLPDRLKDAIQELRSLNQAAPQGFQQLTDDFELAYQNYYTVNTDREQQGMGLLNDMEEKLDFLYETYKAKFALERINLKKSARTEIKAIPLSPPASKVNLLELYRLNQEMHLHERASFPEHYQRFLTLFEAQQKDLDPMERYILCKYTHNALSRALKSGHTGLWPAILHWTKKRLEWTPETITEEGINDYLNAVITGCICEDDHFVEKYINEYSDKLSGEDPHLAVNYAQTELLFLRKQYSRCLETLYEQWDNDKNYHLFYLLRYKKLMFKTSVELLYANNCDVKEEAMIEKILDTEIDSLRRYLDRAQEKISPDVIDQHHTFLSLTKRIVGLIYDNFTQDVSQKAQALYTDIEAVPKVIARKWLLEVSQRLT